MYISFDSRWKNRTILNCGGRTRLSGLSRSMRIHERARFRTFVLFIAPLGLVGCAQASNGAGDTPSKVQVDHDGGSAAETATPATGAGGLEGGATDVSP